MEGKGNSVKNLGLLLMQYSPADCSRVLAIEVRRQSLRIVHFEVVDLAHGDLSHSVVLIVN